MGIISLLRSVIGSSDSIEEPKIVSNFNSLQTLLNGNLDTNNLHPTAAGITATQLAAAVQQAIYATGDVKLTAKGAADTGWLLCDGAAVSRTTYAALYAALGGAASPFGQGDTRTTFNVPDLRGRVPVGAGTGAGLTTRALAAIGGGEALVAQHSHQINTKTIAIPTGSGNQTEVLSTSGGSSTSTNTQASGTLTDGNMPPFVALNYVIKT